MVASILPPKTTLKLHKHRSPVSLSTTPLKGDNADDYTTPVYLNGQGPFALNVDTGSALLGVAGNESIGCDLYYDASSCDGGPIKVVYGSGFWSGVVCEATVTLGEYEIKNYKFGAYQKQQAMTTCERTPEDDASSPVHMVRPTNYMQGQCTRVFSIPPDFRSCILPVGAAPVHLAQRASSPPTPSGYSARAGGASAHFLFSTGIVGLSAGQPGSTKGSAKGSAPLLEVLFATHADVDPVFGLQCCGFDGGRGGGGALDVGGFDARRFYGPIQWVPVTKKPYWAVRTTSVKFGDVEVLPADIATIDAYPDGADQAIVDSGTSGLTLPARAFDAAVEALSAAAPDVPSAFWRGEACVGILSRDVSALPPLTVTLAADEDVVLTMPACRYVNRVPKTIYCAAAPPPHKEDMYFFSVGPMPEGRNIILGQTLFESYYVAHDMGSSPRVGFAPIRGCDADGCGVAPAGSRLGSRWGIVADLVLLPLAVYMIWRRRNRRREYAAVESSV